MKSRGHVPDTVAGTEIHLTRCQIRCQPLVKLYGRLTNLQTPLSHVGGSGRNPAVQICDSSKQSAISALDAPRSL